MDNHRLTYNSIPYANGIIGHLELKSFYENFIMAKESAKICSLSTSDLRILDEIAKVVSER